METIETSNEDGGSTKPWKKEANFCRAVAYYIDAVDKRGIPAESRMNLMMPLFLFFRGLVKIPYFPVRQCAEGNLNVIEEFLIGIQGRLLLYYICSDTGYSARRLGSAEVENAHSILNHLDRRGVGTSSADEVSRQISNLQRMQLLRKKPVGREIFTPKSTIYPAPESGPGLSETLTSGDFDQSRPSGRMRELRPFVRHQPARGVLPVRSLGGHKAHEGCFMKG